MTDPQVAVLMLGIFLFTIMLGFPIAFTLVALAVAFGYYAYFDPGRMWVSYNRAVEAVADPWTLAETWITGFFNNRIFDLLVNQTYSVMANDVLTAVPLFLFMGYIVERANIVDRLFSTLNIASKNLPGLLNRMAEQTGAAACQLDTATTSTQRFEHARFQTVVNLGYSEAVARWMTSRCARRAAPYPMMVSAKPKSPKGAPVSESWTRPMSMPANSAASELPSSP